MPSIARNAPFFLTSFVATNAIDQGGFLRFSFSLGHTHQELKSTDSTMPLTKPKQALRDDLKQAAATLKWAGVDLVAVADRMKATGNERTAIELLEIARSFQEVEDKLEGDLQRVKAGPMEH